MTGSSTRTFLVVLGILVCLLIAVGAAFLPPFWVTLVFGSAVMLFVMARPREGIFLLLVALYYPLLPNVPFGSLEVSTTSLLTFGLFLGTLNLQRRDASLRLVRWQVVLLSALGIAFLLSILFSDSLVDSFLMLPNLMVYWMLLYVFMILVHSIKQLWSIARLILVLGFILSIWRVELRPLRYLFGLPSMGINAAVFYFHPAVALALVMVTMLPKGTVSRFWRLFCWLALFSLVYHGILYQTRGGWLAWIAMAIFIGFQTRGRSRVTFAVGIVGISLMGWLFFSGVIRSNLAQTELSLQAALGNTSYDFTNQDDVARLVAGDAGLRMFYARPVFGWGPGAYTRLKPAFIINYTGKQADYPGAFNSWLISLAEGGLIGTVVALAVFLLPLPLTWRALLKVRNPTTTLAFAFAVGVLGLSIHLTFIDLMYSFAWAHAGLALAASRLALEQRHA
jgi:O-antigen ligase